MNTIDDSRIHPSFVRIRSFLERRDFAGFTGDDLFIKQFIPQGWGQEIATLSNMAEGLRNLALTQSDDGGVITALLAEVVARALSPVVGPYKRGITPATTLGDHGYYLEHLAIVLGCFQPIGGDEHAALNRRIVEHLAERSLLHKHCHAKLLPHVGMRWCADQAAIIYAIWLYDQSNGTDLHAVVAERWLRYMQQSLTHAATGLFQTEALNVKPYSRQPRGCSLAYLIYYTSHFAPDVARAQWALFRQHMLVKRMGLTGFREYLAEYDGDWTPDSGPIIAGIGAAASALGMKASRAVGDYQTYEQLRSASKPALSMLRALSVVPGVGRLARVGTDLLSDSILLCADTTREAHPRELAA